MEQCRLNIVCHLPLVPLVIASPRTPLVTPAPFNPDYSQPSTIESFGDFRYPPISTLAER